MRSTDPPSGDVHVAIESEDGPDHGADEDDQHAGVDHVDAEIGPGTPVAPEINSLIVFFALHCTKGFPEDTLYR